MFGIIKWIRSLDSRISSIESRVVESDKAWRNQIDVCNQRIDSMPRMLRELSESWNQALPFTKDALEADVDKYCEKYYISKFDALKKELDRMINERLRKG